MRWLTGLLPISTNYTNPVKATETEKHKDADNGNGIDKVKINQDILPTFSQSTSTLNFQCRKTHNNNNKCFENPNIRNDSVKTDTGDRNRDYDYDQDKRDDKCLPNRVCGSKPILLCPMCHVKRIYAKEYYDVFQCTACSCQKSISISQPELSTTDDCCCDCHVNDKIPDANWKSPKELLKSVLKLSERFTAVDCPLLTPIPTPTTIKPNGVSDSSSNLAQLNFPPEILSRIFEYLDEETLIRASQVNYRWDELVKLHYGEDFWKQLFLERLPIFQLQIEMDRMISWKNIYAELLDSFACITCFLNATTNCVPVPNFNGNPGTARGARLEKELLAIHIHKIEGIDVLPLDEVKYNWLARLEGPSSTPYQGGVFYLILKFPTNYPYQPCQARFLTKIFHPNITLHGDIQMDQFKNRFSTPADTLHSILLSIHNLLQHPKVSFHFPQTRENRSNNLNSKENLTHFNLFPSSVRNSDGCANPSVRTSGLCTPLHDDNESHICNGDSGKEVDCYNRLERIQEQIQALFIQDIHAFNRIAKQWTNKFSVSHTHF